jgi:hypothetical protein
MLSAKRLMSTAYFARRLDPCAALYRIFPDKEKARFLIGSELDESKFKDRGKIRYRSRR